MRKSRIFKHENQLYIHYSLFSIFMKIFQRKFSFKNWAEF